MQVIFCPKEEGVAEKKHQIERQRAVKQFEAMAAERNRAAADNLPCPRSSEMVDGYPKTSADVVLGHFCRAK